jgi:hypothetical protein
MDVKLMAGDHVSLQMTEKEARALINMLWTAHSAYRRAGDMASDVFGGNLRDLQIAALTMAQTIDKSAFPDEE